MHYAGLKFPETNRAASELLFALEVGLRELIIDVLSECDGPAWHTTRLPADVRRKYLHGLQVERSATWTNHVEHHPLYYIDFPDLSKVLAKNWRAFAHLFANKEVLLGAIKSLEPIRNKLAHNRKLSDADVTIVEAAVTQLESAVGRDYLLSLCERCTASPAIPKLLEELENEIACACRLMLSLAPPKPLCVWQKVESSWWFEHGFLTATNYESRTEIAESQLAEVQRQQRQIERHLDNLRKAYADSSRESGNKANDNITAPIEAFFRLYSDFESQSRGRGTGHRLEAWQHQNRIADVAEDAIKALQGLTKTS